jgi:2-polyprenyl-3-methyl-5-hydroxy-6-metoxy-1,4-benzoquinol methylase
MQNNIPVSIWTNVDCPICISNEARQVYSSTQETGDFLGRITVSLVVCEHCGFVYQNPQISEYVLNDYYSTSTSASGSVYHDIDSNSIHSIKQRDRVHFFRKHLEKMQNIIGEPKLLEIGCSTGDFLVALKLEGWSLYGLEPSVAAAEQADRQGVIVINSSLQNSPGAIETYDAVCAFSVLEHLSDLNRAFSQIHSRLKFGGLLCLEVPDSMRPAPQLAEFFGYEHLWHFTKNTLNNYLIKWGYCNIIYDQGRGCEITSLCRQGT